jgi:hypothetical protein
MEIHHMRAPSGGHVGSSVEFQLFIWRTTGERRNTYGSEDLADPTDLTFRTGPATAVLT